MNPETMTNETTPDSSTPGAGSSSESPRPGWSMPAAVSLRYGTSEVVETTELPVPVPGEGEVLIEVKSASLNALDWHFVTGTPYVLRLQNGLRRPKRTVLASDIAGRVVSLGPDVTDIEIGDEVFGEANGGGCAPYAVMKTKAIAKKPAGVTFQDAAATPVAGLTALQGLRDKADVQPGDHVLINGAAGGVGTFAVQIAKALGAEVTAVCSGRNVEMVRALGADHVVDYTVDDITAGGARFDVMLDNVGNHSLKQVLSMLKPDARFVLVSGPKDGKWLGPIAHMGKVAFAFWRAEPTFSSLLAEPNTADVATLGAWLADGTIVPQIDRVIGLDAVADAIAEIGGGHARAKILVDPSR